MEIETHISYFHEDKPIYCMAAVDALLATGGGDGAIRLWKRAGREKEETLEYECTLRGHTRGVNGIVFSAAHSVLFSGGDDGTVLAWRCGNRTTEHDEYETDGGWRSSVVDATAEQINTLALCKDVLLCGCVSGNILVYTFCMREQETAVWLQTCAKSTLGAVYRGAVQGLACFLSVAAVQTTVRTFLVSHRKKNILEEYPREMFEDSETKIMYRQPTFSEDGSLLYLSAGCDAQGAHCVNIYAYPFRKEMHIGILGPFPDFVTRVRTKDVFLAVLTRRQVFFFERETLLFAVDDVRFSAATDGLFVGNRFYVAGLDGFVTSVKYK